MADHQLTFLGAANPFDAIRQVRPNGTEYWSARDLQELLGYDRFDRFEDAIERAKVSCELVSGNASDHFSNAGKMVPIGSGATRIVPDYHLSRYGAYLVAMNGDTRKGQVAAAQTYFAVKTREREVDETNPMMALPQDYPSALRRLADKWEEAEREKAARVAAETRLALAAPKVAFHDTCMEAKNSILVRQLAKIVNDKFGFKTGGNRLWDILREWGLIIKGSTEPTQKALDAGWFEVIQRPVGKKVIRLESTTKVTPKGQEYIINRLRNSAA